MDITETSKTELSDELLCRLAAQKDTQAEELLVLRYRRFARACARPYFLAGGDSEDLSQEAMLGLLSAIRSFDGTREASFRTFAEVCIRNRVRSAVTSAAREKHTPLNRSVSMENHAERLQPQTGPEENLIGREEVAERLEGLNRRLSLLERRILALYLDGCSCAEIAQRTGRSKKSVDNAIQRIRRKAAKYLGVISES